jgi:acetyl esterase
VASTPRQVPALPVTRLVSAAVVLLALGSCALAACGSRASESCEPLGQGEGDAAYLLPGTRVGIPYARRGNTTLRFDSFRHADDLVRPAAVILRGGTATIGARTSFVGQFVELFAGAGYQVVLPDYRSSSATTAREDLIALFATLGCHGAALGVDPYRVVVVAEDSAGDPALDVTQWLARFRRGRSAAQPSPPRATVVIGGRHVRPPSVIEDPTLLVHGEADREVSIDAVRAVCATATTGVACDVIGVPDGIHRPENWTPAQWGYKPQLLDWLAGHVGGTPPPPAWPEDARLTRGVLFDATHDLRLDAFVPDGDGPHPAALLVHGGGWEAGDRVTYITPMFTPLTRGGLAWFSIDYRLTPGVTNDAQLDDVRAALAYIRAHASYFRLDPARIVLVGESASGQLVSQLAAEGVDAAGVVSFYGVYDLEAMAGDPSSPRSLARRLFGLTSLDDEGRATLRRFSPLHRAHGGMVPILLVTGTADGLWAQAQAFERALHQAGARYESVVLRDAPHGMEQWDGDARWPDWSAQVVDWILRVTSGDGRRPRESSPR